MDRDCMLEILKKCGYVPPQLKEWKKENIEVSLIDECFYQLKVNGEPWMTYSPFTPLQQATELFSHYHLAKGHCVCTGMGFGIRENWLMSKKEVSKITIVEKNEQVLEYHKYNQSPFLKECEVVIGDASELNGKCDTLLLDHYEKESYEDIIKDVKKISNNMDCHTLWFWPLERLILDYKTNNSKLFSNYQSYSQIYEEIKTKSELSKLPDLDEETLKFFVFFFFYTSVDFPPFFV